MTFCILCGINSNHSDIKKKGGVHSKNYHQIICRTQWWQWWYGIYSGCYWQYDFRIFRRLILHESKIKCLFGFYFHHFSSVVCRPSVNISHFNLLLRNHWANCNQTLALVEWSLDGPLWKMCLVIPTSIQDGRQAKNRKNGGWNFNCPLLL